jgi:hypothetical protein
LLLSYRSKSAAAAISSLRFTLAAAQTTQTSSFGPCVASLQTCNPKVGRVGESLPQFQLRRGLVSVQALLWSGGASLALLTWKSSRAIAMEADQLWSPTNQPNSARLRRSADCSDANGTKRTPCVGDIAWFRVTTAAVAIVWVEKRRGWCVCVVPP